MRLLGTVLLLLFFDSPAYAQVTNPPGGNGGGGGTYCYGIFIENIREQIDVNLDQSTISNFDVRFGGEFPMSREIEIEGFDDDDTINVLPWELFPITYLWDNKLNTTELLPRDLYGVCKATTYLTGIAGGDTFPISASGSAPRQQIDALMTFDRLPSIDPTTGQYLTAPAGEDFIWGRLRYDTFFDSSLDTANEINVYLVSVDNSVEELLFRRNVSNIERGIASDTAPEGFVVNTYANGAGTAVKVRADLLNDNFQVIDTKTFLVVL